MMDFESVKTAVKDLSSAERRKIALYILELEKADVQKKYGPRISEELDNAAKAFQEAVEKLKKFMGTGA